MLVDDSHGFRVVMQPETQLEQHVLKAMQESLKGVPAGEDGGIVAYYTADLDRYPQLSDELQGAAQHWKDIGYRALVVLWR